MAPLAGGVEVKVMVCGANCEMTMLWYPWPAPMVPTATPEGRSICVGVSTFVVVPSPRAP